MNFPCETCRFSPCVCHLAEHLDPGSLDYLITHHFEDLKRARLRWSSVVAIRRAQIAKGIRPDAPLYNPDGTDIAPEIKI